jgi:hypothetical protein
MKKILFRLLIALLVLLVLAFVAVGLFMGRALKGGVEKYGSQYTKVDVKLNTASLSLFSGAGKLKKFVLGNPEGFKSGFAISMDTAGLSLKPASVFGDKVVIKSISFESPEIAFEVALTGNNLKKILSNLQETTGGGEKSAPQPAEPQPAAAKSSKKLQVDDFLIKGGKIHLSANTPVGEKSATLSLPEIHLTNLGQGPDGITGAELAKIVLTAIETEAAKIAATAIPQLQSGALFLGNDSGKGGTNNMDKATKAVGDFLKKK